MQPAQHDSPQHPPASPMQPHSPARRPDNSVQSPIGRPKGGLWHNTTLHATLLGLVGALLAWAAGEIPQRWSQTWLADFAAYQAAAEQIAKAYNNGDLTPAQNVEAANKLNHAHVGNPYVKILNNRDYPAKRKTYQIARMQDQDRRRTRMGQLAWFCVAGLILGLLLAPAESLAARNMHAVKTHAAVGGLCGLAGGFLVCVFINELYRAVPAGPLDGLGLARQIVGRGLSWAVLGAFLGPASGILMGSAKRLWVGLAGGALGGLVGGALFELACLATGSAVAGRAIALVAMGAGIGLATCLIENATRTGWLLVVAGGGIAGKQFVLYRKVTCLGSSRSDAIRLCHDSRVAPRHTAIRAIPGSYEIEDLHTGRSTLLNGRPIDRAVLTSGDLIQIGSTCLLFRH